MTLNVSFFFEASSCSAIEEIPHLLLIPNCSVLHHSQEPALVPIQSQINPVYPLLSHLLHLHCNIILAICPGLLSDLFS